MLYLPLCLYFLSVQPILGLEDNIKKWMFTNYGCNSDEAIERLFDYFDKGMEKLEPRTRKTLQSMIEAGFSENFDDKMKDYDVMERENVCAADSNNNTEPTGIFRKSSLDTDNAGFDGNSAPHPKTPPKVSLLLCKNMGNAKTVGNNVEKMHNDEVHNDDVTEINNWGFTGNSQNEMKKVGPTTTLRKSMFGADEDLPNENVGVKKDDDVIEMNRDSDDDNRNEMRPKKTFRKFGRNNFEDNGDEEPKTDDEIVERNKWRSAGNNQYVRPTTTLRKSLFDTKEDLSNENDAVKMDDDVNEMNNWSVVGSSQDEMKNVGPKTTLRKSLFDTEEDRSNNNGRVEDDGVTETNNWGYDDNNHYEMRNVRPPETFRKSLLGTEEDLPNENGGVKKDDDVIEMNNWDSDGKNHYEMRNVRPTGTFRKSLLITEVDLPNENDGVKRDDDVIEMNNRDSHDNNRNEMRNVGPKRTFRKFGRSNFEGNEDEELSVLTDDLVKRNNWGSAGNNHHEMRNARPTETFDAEEDLPSVKKRDTTPTKRKTLLSLFNKRNNK